MLETTLPERPRSLRASRAIEQLARRERRLPRRRFALGGLVLVALIVELMIVSFRAAVSDVVSPSQLLQRGAAVYGQTVQLDGRVDGAAHDDRAAGAYVFRVSDARATVVVSYGGDLPGGFQPGASIQAKGTYDGRAFSASTLTAKCPTKYQAPAHA